MEDTSQIFNMVCQYLNGEIGLSGLEDWVAARFGLLATLPLSPARDLYGVIELGLAEMNIGHRSEDEFRDTLGEFIRSRDFIFVSSVESQADHVSSMWCTTRIYEWAPMALPPQQHPEWKYADIELGRVS